MVRPSRGVERVAGIVTLVVAAVVSTVTGMAEAVVPGPGAFELVSIGVGGQVPPEDPGRWDNMQVLDRRSAGVDGSTVVFVGRSGQASEPDHVPFAEGEDCSADYCRDLYVRDLDADVTTPVTAALPVENRHPFSIATVASGGGQWAVSTDHDTFVYGWRCYGDFEHGPEVIGGTKLCDPDAEKYVTEGLVLHDLSSGQAQVLAAVAVGSFVGPAVDDTGDTVLYSDVGPTDGRCFSDPRWSCADEDSRARLWRRGVGTATITATIAFDEPALSQIQMLQGDLSGDGSTVVLVGQELAGFDDTLASLYRYDVATAELVELPMDPEEARGSWGLLGVSRDGGTAVFTLTAYVEDPEAERDFHLAVVDTATGARRLVADVGCTQTVGSVSADARWVGCWRFRQQGLGGWLSPAVVDTTTGRVVEVATSADGFDPYEYYHGPYVSADGNRAVALAHGPVDGTIQPHVWAFGLGGTAGPTVTVLGGAAAVSDATVVEVGALVSSTPRRLAGPDRYATAAQVAAYAFPSATPVVYVATGETFPDALGGAAAAASDDAPVLLTHPAFLSPAASEALARLQPQEVIVVGGTAAVSDDVLSEIAIASGVEPRRLSGPTRYDTAAAVVADAFPSPVPTVFVATGENFPDALSGSAAAAELGAPVLLVTRDAVPASVAAQLERLQPSQVKVLGGPSAVSEAVVSQLGAITGTTPQRLAGADRYATAVKVAENAFGAVNHLVLATGQNFPDALAGSAAAARLGAPVVLVSRDAVPPVVAGYLTSVS
jgi:putative cell wall-binding protein